MCCFSRSVPFVGDTKIFARIGSDGRQWLAYSMTADVQEELAMVLPLPVPLNSLDDAVSFIDLSGYPTLFADIASGFPEPLSFAPAQRGGPPGRSVAKLVVHDVGAFEASFVPRVSDFARLDERFRLSSAFFQALPRVRDYGFAVFQLKPKRKRQTIHPMAFAFPRRDTRALFFPTVHVHDRTVPAYAKFDHALYCQPTPLVAALLGWARSEGVMGPFVDCARARGLVASDAHAFALPVMGELPNEDIWLSEPEGVSLGDLEGRGECHAFRVAAKSAFTPVVFHERSMAWRETALNRLPALCRGLAEGLRTLEREARAAFALGPLTDDLAPHFLNGPQLWSGTSYMDGKPHDGGGPGLVRFTPFTKQVELQSVTLGFRELPSPSLTREISRALETILDRSVGGT